MAVTRKTAVVCRKTTLDRWTAGPAVRKSNLSTPLATCAPPRIINRKALFSGLRQVLNGRRRLTPKLAQLKHAGFTYMLVQLICLLVISISLWEMALG